MGFFRLIHDFIGLNGNRLKGSIREASQKMRETKEKLRNTERVRKLSYKSHKLN